MLSKVMIERGHVDTRNRVMTLVCINVTWGTTVQFVQVCTRLVDRGRQPSRRCCGCNRLLLVLLGGQVSRDPCGRGRRLPVRKGPRANQTQPCSEFEMRREESSGA